MSIFTLILIGFAGILIGYAFAKRNPLSLKGQSKTKHENLEKILVFVSKHGKITNNDVEELVGVSNTTAERYLNELEHEGKLIQHGTTGVSVFYTSL